MRRKSSAEDNENLVTVIVERLSELLTKIYLILEKITLFKRNKKQ